MTDTFDASDEEAPNSESTPEPGTDLEVRPPDDLSMIPSHSEFHALAEQAAVLANSGLVPKGLYRKPHDVLLVLMTGRDLGLSPTTALRKCYVVDGQVTVAPMIKLGRVSKLGLGKIRPPHGGDPTRGIDPDPDFPNTAERATAIAYDEHGYEIGRASITMNEAKKIDGGKLVNKSNWRNYPARMLWARVSGYVVDDFFPEASLGLYTPDEMGATTDADGEILELDSIEMPVGFERRGGSAGGPVETIGEADARMLKLRANGLPGVARKVLKDQLCEREIGGFPDKMLASKVKIVGSLLDSLEKRAEAGEWGEWVKPATGEAQSAPEATGAVSPPVGVDAATGEVQSPAGTGAAIEDAVLVDPDAPGTDCGVCFVDPCVCAACADCGEVPCSCPF